MKRLIFALIGLMVTVTPTVHAAMYDRDGIYFTCFSGTAGSARTPLTLYRNDAPEYTQDAHWVTRAFGDSPYWLGRLERWDADGGWGIEIIHHKMYLNNPSGDIIDFSISDGLNTFLIDRAFRMDWGVLRLGAGWTVSHPDVSLVGRDRYWRNSGLSNWGFHPSGPTVQVSAERWFFEFANYFVTFETKLTAAYITTPISNTPGEYARTSNLALHVDVGLGSKPVPENANLIDYGLFFLPYYFPNQIGDRLTPFLFSHTN